MKFKTVTNSVSVSVKWLLLSRALKVPLEQLVTLVLQESRYVIVGVVAGC